jgi:hypothetical protein
MPPAVVTRVFVPASALSENVEGLEPASGDETFFVVGAPGRFELAGFLVPVNELEDRGIPRRIGREVALIASLRTTEHMMLLKHEGGIWELLVLSDKAGQPDTFTFKEGG